MKILNFIVLLSLTLVLSQSSFAQPIGENLLPVSVVQRLFEGMRKGDSSMVHSTFAKHVTLATIFKNKENEPFIKHEVSIQDFLNAVGTPHGDIWYEEIWNVKVEVDDDLAAVWCSYAFFLNDSFSHCGVDAFHLHKEKEGWKIFHLADTRRKTDCSIPQSIKEKHNGN